MTSKAAFYASLPAKRMAAGVLFFDEEGKLLIVQPTYKATWEIPGGIVERHESPRAAAIREVYEELGLTIAASEISLVLLDYMAAGTEKTEALMFVFAGPVLTRSVQGKIVLCREEIASMRFVTPEEGASLLGAVLGQRVLKAVERIQAKEFGYFEGSVDTQRDENAGSISALPEAGA